MALKVTFKGDPKDDSKKVYEGMRERIIDAFTFAGEEFVTDCRTQPGDHTQGFYEDKTGNLRNSIAYYIFENGELIRESVSEFSEANKQELQPYVSKTGFQLFGIAGMYYASYVESKGYNVMSLQADRCLVNLEQYIDDIRNYSNRANNV